ncbi:hypothetical protein BDR04DRAFT_812250 [Suillus decipiens]|nr:hypothetical protein BDR04DRAFT_812250 [Suillus decipiens]
MSEKWTVWGASLLQTLGFIFNSQQYVPYGLIHKNKRLRRPLRGFSATPRPDQNLIHEVPRKKTQVSSSVVRPTSVPMTLSHHGSNTSYVGVLHAVIPSDPVSRPFSQPSF